MVVVVVVGVVGVVVVVVVVVVVIVAVVVVVVVVAAAVAVAVGVGVGVGLWHAQRPNAQRTLVSAVQAAGAIPFKPKSQASRPETWNPKPALVIAT